MLGAGRDLKNHLTFLNDEHVSTALMKEIMSMGNEAYQNRTARQGCQAPAMSNSVYKGRDLGAVNQKLDGLFILSQKYWLDKHKTSMLAPANGHVHNFSRNVATKTVPEIHSWILKEAVEWFKDVKRPGQLEKELDKAEKKILDDAETIKSKNQEIKDVRSQLDEKTSLLDRNISNQTGMIEQGNLREKTNYVHAVSGAR